MITTGSAFPASVLHSTALCARSLLLKLQTDERSRLRSEYR